MPTFTVHQPPPRKGESESDPERFAFIRDGFHFWAFLLAPLWLLVHRLWLALLLYVVATAAINAGLTWAGASGTLRFIATFCIALLIGFEAAALWRWTLQRRKWKTVGFVVADNGETAERRFYAQWVNRPSEAARKTPASATPAYATPVGRGAPSGSDVIGLFPEPGAQR